MCSVSRSAVIVAAAVLSACGPALRRVIFVPPAMPVSETSDGRAREDSPNEANAFYLLKRTGGKPLPMERLFAARRHARGMPAYSLANRRFLPRAAGTAEGSAGNLGTWVPLGPGNVGGRTRSLVIHPNDPNTMYAGSVSGGVWKTVDAGQSWKPLTDLLPSIGISTIAMDPTNPEVLYAGTGEWFTGSTMGDSVRGAGIFKTIDGGLSWTQLPFTSLSSFYYVNRIVVSPVDSNHVYAATYGGVWASLDGGASWTRSMTRTGNLYGCQDLAIRSDQPTDYVFAACAVAGGAEPGVYRNVDAAGSGQWEVVFTEPRMGRTALALAPSNQSTIYAFASSSEPGNYLYGMLGVYCSDSNGDNGSWNPQVTNQDANRLNTVLLTNPRESFADVCSDGVATYNNQGDYDISIAV